MENKELLKLKYSNLLNWRTIIFAFYFALLALAGTYASKLSANITDNLFALSTMGIAIWIVFNEFKYSEIKDELEKIEKHLH